MALRGDDPVRLSRALAIDSVYRSLAGPASGPSAARVRTEAARLAAACGDPYAKALCALAAGVGAFFGFDWRRAVSELESAEALLLEGCSGTVWELGTAHLMWCVSLFFLGRLGELLHSLPALLEKANLRGDRYESTDL